jgi:hypothetical protein
LVVVEMATEEDVYNWIILRMKNCPGSANVTRENIKKIYKGSMKDVLDSMCLSLRSSADIQEIREYMERKKLKELLKEKFKAEQIIKELQQENDILKEKSIKTGVYVHFENSKLELELKESMMKLENHMIENQCQVTQELYRKGIKMGVHLSPTFIGLPAPQVSYTFNANQSKLETSLKSDIRKVLKDVSYLENAETMISNILQIIAKYPCHERCSTLLELYEELANTAQKITDAVDLDRDAKFLSEELQDEDPGTDVVQHLQRKIDSLILEHSKLVLNDRKRIEVEMKLAQQLSSMLLFKPDATSAATVAMLKAQVSQLRESTRQLILQDGQDHKSHAEKARMISDIHNFNENMERRKQSIVELIGMMGKLTSQTWQLHKKTSLSTQIVDNKYEVVVQLSKLQKEQIKVFTELRPGTLMPRENVVPLLPGISSNLLFTFLQSMALNLVEKIDQVKLLKINTGSWKHEVQKKHTPKYCKAEVLGNLEVNKISYPNSLQDIQLHLIPEITSFQHKLEQKFKNWKEQPHPIHNALLQDGSTTAAGMTYGQCLEFLEHR